MPSPSGKTRRFSLAIGTLHDCGPGPGRSRLHANERGWVGADRSRPTVTVRAKIRLMIGARSVVGDLTGAHNRAIFAPEVPARDCGWLNNRRDTRYGSPAGRQQSASPDPVRAPVGAEAQAQDVD